MRRTRSALALTGLATALAVPLVASPAQAAAVCDGAYVRTCVNLTTDGGYYYRASASIRDTEAGSNYKVAVAQLVVEVNDRGRWELFHVVSRDADGWHDTEDRAASPNSHFCRGYGYTSVRAKATMRWQRAGTSTVTTEVVTSQPESIPCYA